MASMVTKAPVKCSRSSSSGIAAISLDLVPTAWWPSTGRWRAAQALTTCSGCAAPRPARGFAVDGHDVGLVLAQAFDPGGKASAEQFRVERSHDVVKRAVGGNAPLERPQRPQERQLLLAPEPNLDNILGTRERRAKHKQHDLR
jgi:hypothetical protein